MSVVQVMVAVVCAGVFEEIEEMTGADGVGFPPPPCELATVTEIVDVAKLPDVSSATASSVYEPSATAVEFQVLSYGALVI